MGRRALIAALPFAAVLFLLAGCGSQGVVAPVPQTVEGKVPKSKPTTPQAPKVKGNPTAGKALFLSTGGCGACHSFTPAGTNGTVGPNLDHLSADAAKANQGSIQSYAYTSIVDPNAYVVPGFNAGIMPQTYSTQFSQKQIADLVAFLTQKS
jgi:mono/diheme cytochrome c family protein